MNPHRLLMVDVAGSSLSANERAFFKDYQFGGVCLFRRNFTDRYQAAELTGELRSLLGDDLIVTTDQEGGGVVRATDLPNPPGTMLLGAVDDLALTRQVAAATARGLRSVGVNVVLAPVADVNVNPRNPVIGERSFGADPQKVAAQVAAFVQGLQSEGVAATVKHFPGHGDTATDSHLALPRLDADLARLHATELVPFKAAIEAGTACVMSYHGLVSVLDADEPATLSRRAMTDLLRGELGFQGVSFTDALEMQAVAERHSPAEAAVRALAAGIDMPLYDVHEGSLGTFEDILKGIDRAVNEGRLEPRDLEQKLERLRRLSEQYPARPDPNKAWQEGDKELLQKTARNAVTVLGTLKPLQKGSSLTLVAARNQVGGAASDLTETPAKRLAEVLEARGFSVNRAFYDRDTLEAGKSKTDVNPSDTVLFVTASRTRMGEDEKQFAQRLARAAPNFTHVALWNPYHVQDLPAPAVVSFGFQEVSLNAVADVLTGGAARGVSPVELHV